MDPPALEGPCGPPLGTERSDLLALPLGKGDADPLALPDQNGGTRSRAPRLGRGGSGPLVPSAQGWTDLTFSRSQST